MFTCTEGAGLESQPPVRNLSASSKSMCSGTILLFRVMCFKRNYCSSTSWHTSYPDGHWRLLKWESARVDCTSSNFIHLCFSLMKVDKRLKVFNEEFCKIVLCKFCKVH